MRKFWLYFGIILASSGIGTGLGILLVLFYFWDDIKSSIFRIQENNTETNSSSSASYYDDQTLDEMK
jgi:hypothetical protein